MASTLLLSTDAWDLVVDAHGNIAAASEPYSLAQDAASAIKTFGDTGPGNTGECFWDTTIGVPYMTRVFGKRPSVAELKQLFTNAALTVPDVASAACFIVSGDDRGVSGQVQVTSKSTGKSSAANFSVVNPQGPG